MKLDTKAFRYLAPEDWRVLTGVELGSKNHEVVPTPLIIQLSGLRAGSSGATRSISTLAKANLIARVQNMKYDGYRLTYGGLDYLALHSHTKSNSIVHLGSQMGVGKESDIYLVTSPNPDTTSTTTQISTDSSSTQQQPIQAILKLHRLGRISFRTIRTNRSYQGNRGQCSWQYLSRLSAHKEYLAMQALYSVGLPVPRPIAWSRHAIVMSLVPAIPLRQVPLSAFGSEKGGRDERIARLYGECMELTLKLAELGLIHGDFNEFNILVENVPNDVDGDLEDEDISGTTDPNSPNSEPIHPSQTTPFLQSREGPTKPLTPHLIDFPQITSLSHPQASTFFLRDVDCIKRFFQKRYHFTSSDSGPTFEDAMARLETAAAAGKSHRRLDVEIEAAGFSRKMAKELGSYYEDASPGDEGEEDGIRAGEVEEESKQKVVLEEELEMDGVVPELLVTEQAAAAPVTHYKMQDIRADGDSNAEVIRLEGQEDMSSDLGKVKSIETSLGHLDLSSKPSIFIKSSRSKTKAAAGWSI